MFNTRDFAHYAAREIFPSVSKHKYYLSSGGVFKNSHIQVSLKLFLTSWCQFYP